MVFLFAFAEDGVTLLAGVILILVAGGVSGGDFEALHAEA